MGMVGGTMWQKYTEKQVVTSQTGEERQTGHAKLVLCIIILSMQGILRGTLKLNDL